MTNSQVSINQKIYFEGLSELRAIAALFVIFHHIELYKYRDKISSLYDNVLLNHFISNLGKNGVFIFFVLSGFLITSLLLKEKCEYGKVSIKKFYIRRILRIWPLYYLIIFLSFIVIPLLANHFQALQNEKFYYSRILELQNSSYFTLFLFLAFLPNLALKLRPPVVGAAQAWSVGVEEQFYLIWPNLFNMFKNKNHLLFSFVIISILPIYSKIISFVNYDISLKINKIIGLLPIHFMAIGAIGAYIYFYYREYVLRITQNNIFFYLNTILIIFLLFISINSLIFAIIVIIEIMFIINTDMRINLRNKYLKMIGDISYGIYMYHPFVMYIGFSVFNSIIPIQNIIIYNMCIYVFILFFTILLSAISYNHFESRFIKIKNEKYTLINKH
jgi:peptidoglycan/LPS O-acetylase OafA/YrhL